MIANFDQRSSLRVFFDDDLAAFDFAHLTRKAIAAARHGFDQIFRLTLPSFTSTQFANLRVMHFEAGNWVNVTAAINTFPTLCTNPVTSFSPFSIANVGPTAAAVSVGGRVVTANGYGIVRVRVSLTNMAGETRIVFTNSFGYYRFPDVPTGENYTVGVDAKRYRFKDSSRVIVVMDEIADLDFVAVP